MNAVQNLCESALWSVQHRTPLCMVLLLHTILQSTVGNYGCCLVYFHNILLLEKQKQLSFYSMTQETLTLHGLGEFTLTVQDLILYVWQEVVMFVLTLCCWCQCTSGHQSLVSSPHFLSALLLPSFVPPLSPWLSSSGIPSPAPRLASLPPPVSDRLESSPTDWSPSRRAAEDRDRQPGQNLTVNRLTAFR